MRPAERAAYTPRVRALRGRAAVTTRGRALGAPSFRECAHARYPGKIVLAYIRRAQLASQEAVGPRVSLNYWFKAIVTDPKYETIFAPVSLGNPEPEVEPTTFWDSDVDGPTPPSAEELAKRLRRTEVSRRAHHHARTWPTPVSEDLPIIERREVEKWWPFTRKGTTSTSNGGSK